VIGRYSAALACVAILLGCATERSGGGGDPDRVSAEQAVAPGAEAAARVAREIGLVDDPLLHAYVTELGARVAAQAPGRDRGLAFHVVDMPEPNAFALPGGDVDVSRGLLALVNSEDELAHVIAHEVAHVAAGHPARREAGARDAGIVAPPNVEDGGATRGQGGAGGGGIVASYSREQEREADRFGQALAARAGYDPGAFADVLRSLERERTLRLGRTRQPSFLDSHPSRPERSAAAAARARTLVRAPAAPIAATRADFLGRLEGLVLGVDPARGIFRGPLFLHPLLGFQVRFPGDWRLLLSPSAVGASEPHSRAMILLTAQEEGSDPRAAAERFSASERLGFTEAGPLRIRDQRAYRAVALLGSQSGPLGVELTWIAHGGTVYRLQAISAEVSFSRFAEAFRSTAESFAPLSPEQRAGFRQRRLQIVTSRAGETLEQLSRRTGNAWSAADTAVMNGIWEPSRPLGGQRLKIALERPLAP
jgi:predicted Zn-dependent protease